MSNFRRRLMMGGGYTFLEYIQFSGGQYIDTGVRPTNNMQFSFRASLDDPNGTLLGTGTQSFGIGLYSSLISTLHDYYNLHFVHASQYYDQTLGTSYDGSQFQVNLDDNHFYVYDRIVYTFSPLPASIADLPSFYLGDSNGSNPTYGRLIGKVYSLNIYHNHVRQVGLYPILDRYNRPCFLDVGSGKIFRNLGTGELIAGPKI